MIREKPGVGCLGQSRVCYSRISRALLRRNQCVRLSIIVWYVVLSNDVMAQLDSGLRDVKLWSVQPAQLERSMNEARTCMVHLNLNLGASATDQLCDSNSFITS